MPFKTNFRPKTKKVYHRAEKETSHYRAQCNNYLANTTNSNAAH
jgi:hypothetical protein